MKNLALCLALLALVASSAHADRPAVVAISSETSVCIKLTDTSGYKPGTAVSYDIRHWPDGAAFTSGTIPGGILAADPWGLWSFLVFDLKPKLWSPQDPQLYHVTVTDSTGHVLGKTRFGFRSFEAKGDKLYLNGRPIFLRGLPINPPGRDVDAAAERDPRFIRGYIKLLKSAGVNMIRTEPQDWLDACDELGMMLFAGHYGGAGGKGPDAPAFDKAQPFYRDLILGLASHPGVVIYVLSNEVDYKSANSTYKDFLTRVREDVRSMDPTRPVIGNAGFGHGQPGEIYDVHRYAGWYYGSVCDWYNDVTTYLTEARKADQPFTMTECVGAYTSDAGDFLTMSKQLCTMTKWVGTAKDPRAAARDYQAELVKQVVEISRRYRSNAGSIAGVMPFTYVLGWARAKKPESIIIKPAFEALRTSFQPVLISPECWHRDLYSGDNLEMRLCVANDDELGRDLAASRAIVEVVSADGHVVASSEVGIPATRYYSNSWADLSIPIPADTPKGYYEVRCRLIENSKETSHNSFCVSVAPRDWARTSGLSVTVFDPSGKTTEALAALGVSCRQIADLAHMPASGTLVIGEGALGKDTYPSKQDVLSFLDRGGRMLCLRQVRGEWSPDWLPATFTMEQRSPYRRFTYIQPRENAAIFDGLSDRDLRFWNEIGSGSTPDICPVLTALKPANVSDLRSARVWASCDQLLSGGAIVELFHGHGRVVLSQFRTVERVDTDPIAAKLLANLVAYACSSKTASPLNLSKPIRWDQTAFRSGAFVSNLQGLLPHSATYTHAGNSKGRLGDDHRIDGFTLVGDYSFTSNGWLTPVPDPKADGWGIFYGALSRPATRFMLRLSNPGKTAAMISLELDGKPVGSPISVAPGASRSIEWRVQRGVGPVEVKLRGDQRLVITESCFK